MNPINLLNEDERAAIERIVSFHKNDGRFPAACLVGSLAKGHFTETSDIDLIIFTNVEDFNLEAFCPFVTQLEHNALLKDDAYDFLIGARNASILYKNYSAFVDNIHAIISGMRVDMYYKEWAYVGVIDDVLLLDISNAIVLYDEKEELNTLADSLKFTYPYSLKSAIIASSIRLIETKGKGIIRFNGNFFISSVAANEMLTAYIRYVYAKHERYNPGLKHIFTESNQAFLETNMPELFECYQVYKQCPKDNYELLFSFIREHTEN